MKIFKLIIVFSIILGIFSTCSARKEKDASLDQTVESTTDNSQENAESDEFTVQETIEFDKKEAMEIMRLVVAGELPKESLKELRITLLDKMLRG